MSERRRFSRLSATLLLFIILFLIVLVAKYTKSYFASRADYLTNSRFEPIAKPLR